MCETEYVGFSFGLRISATFLCEVLCDSSCNHDSEQNVNMNLVESQPAVTTQLFRINFYNSFCVRAANQQVEKCKVCPRKGGSVADSYYMPEALDVKVYNLCNRFKWENKTLEREKKEMWRGG